MTPRSHWSTTAARLPRFQEHLHLLLLLTCAAGGLGLALHHPLDPAIAMAMWLLWAMWVAWHPSVWLWVLPAALPVANLSPWTGWLVFDEFDLLVLATVSGLLARNRFFHRASPRLAACPIWQVALMMVLLGLWSCGTVVGALNAPLSSWHLFANHESGMWTLRASKALLWALLLWPWLRLNLLQAPQHTLHRIGVGMVLGLAVVSAVAINERLAYPGLTDFISHYRTTALFWEMHVGGAAIDAYLALATPFAVWALWHYGAPPDLSLRDRPPKGVEKTWERPGVFLSAPPDLSLRARPPKGVEKTWERPGVFSRGGMWLMASLLAVCVTYAALTTFARGVYLAAVVGVVVWLLARYAQLLAQAKPSRGMRWLARCCLLLLTLCACAGLLWLTFVHMGLWGALGCSLLLTTLAFWLRWRAKHGGWQLPAGLVLGTVLLIEIAAVLGGDSFMNQRLEEGPADLESRMSHWRGGVGLLQTPTQWLMGLGAGRFPAAYAASDPSRDFPGRLNWSQGPDRAHAVLEGPRYRDDLGGLFSATQRVPLLSQGSYSVRLRAKTTEPLQLLARVCEKHLLYDRRCQNAVFTLPANANAAADDWTELNRRLIGKRLDSGTWWAPRQAVFSLSVLTTGGVALLAQVDLFDPQGQPLLSNSDFSEGLAHWFPRAQRFYLPWHTDNLALELLIERGLLGVLVFGLLVTAAARALVRALAWPDAQGGGLVPVLLASMASVLAVGLVSSVLDVPRIAFLVFFILLLGLSLGEKYALDRSNASALGPVQKTPPAL